MNHLRQLALYYLEDYIHTYPLEMLCDKCWGMLRGHEGRVWKGTYDLHFNHHDALESLKKSADLVCGICRLLYETWNNPDRTMLLHQQVGESQRGHDESTSQTGAETPYPFSTASLSVVRDVDEHDLFKLDFQLKHGKKTRKRTFVLKQSGQSICLQDSCSSKICMN